MCGELLYELATGKAPSFESASDSKIHAIPMAGSPALRRPRKLRPDLPESVEQIIYQAVAHDPDKRYPSAASTAGSLSEALKELTRQETTPQGDIEVASLFWALKASQTEIDQENGARIENLKHVDDQSNESFQDRIDILLADKTIQTVLFNPPAMTIGRGNDNDIVLNQPGISRHHARIEFDGQLYRIVDLDSRN